jgi:hypothetical protein
MKWKGYDYYAQSDKGYRVSKSYIGGRAKYVCHCPKKRLMPNPAYYTFKEARIACEEHYVSSNRESTEDMF